MSNYVTMDEATTYIGHRLGGKSWMDAEVEDQEASLTMATQSIDNMRYVGQFAVANQEHAFPRQIWYGGTKEYKTQSVVPQVVKDACCEEAWFLQKYGNNERIVMQALGVRRASREGVAEEYIGVDRGLLSPVARALLRRWFAGGVPLQR